MIADENAAGKWAKLTTAPNQAIAEMWQEALARGGIITTIEADDTTSFLGVSFIPCRILVPEDQLDKAKDILRSLGVKS